VVWRGVAKGLDEAVLASSGASCVTDGRFKGGSITREFGAPLDGLEALQMELACRAYMAEPDRPTAENWPTPTDETRAAETRARLRKTRETVLGNLV
jgi:formiminoglutamase